MPAKSSSSKNTSSSSVSKVEPAATVSQSTNEPQKKSRKGCWIVATIGCALIVLIIGVIVAFFVLAASLSGDWSGSVSEEVLKQGSGGKIAVIRVEGVITESASEDLFSTPGATTEVINNEIDKALQDDDVEGIILKISSPGGEAVASDLVYRKVMEARKEKKVVSWMSVMGASGAYMVASGSDEIVAHPGCMTGSIGVIMQFINYDELYDKIGVEVKTFKTGEFKDDSEIFDDDPNGEAEQIFETMLDEAYDSFITAIVEGRDMDRSTVENLADGRIYTGQQAYENGLVDKVGDMDDAVKSMEELLGEKDLEIVEYSTGGFWNSFYEYQQVLLKKLNAVPTGPEYGLRSYYLLDL